MSRNYKFHNPEGLYFISFAVVGWLDVFTRNEYKDLFLDSLRFCQKEKGLEIHAWCIMSSHVHLVFRSIKGQKPELLIGDLKRYTSKSIVKAIEENPLESRKQFLLEFFRKEVRKVLMLLIISFGDMIINPLNYEATVSLSRKLIMCIRIQLKRDWCTKHKIIFIAAQEIMQMRKDFWMI